MGLRLLEAHEDPALIHTLGLSQGVVRSLQSLQLGARQSFSRNAPWDGVGGGYETSSNKSRITLGLSPNCLDSVSPFVSQGGRFDNPGKRFPLHSSERNGWLCLKI